MHTKAQALKLKTILYSNDSLKKALEITPQLNLPDWYIAGGVVSQTVWNYYHGFELNSHIKDIDLVYYDNDTSYEAEDKFIQKAEALFADVPIEVEVRNQARVHLWYKGASKNTPPYKSTQEGIASWLTKVTCIGVTTQDGNFNIYAPYGLDDLFNLIVKPNKVMGNKQAYDEKTNRWRKVWPNLTIIDWDSE